MNIQLRILSRLPSPPPVGRASPWPTQTTTPSISFSRKRISNEVVRAQGRGFGVTTESSSKRTKPTQGNVGGDQDEEDAIPQEVFSRMLGRIVFFVGFPMGSGIGLLYVLGILKEKAVWEVPEWLPFLTILLSFGTSAFGIAYGTLSSSWDPEKEGSLLGWEQAQKNWPELWKEEEEDAK